MLHYVMYACLMAFILLLFLIIFKIDEGKFKKLTKNKLYEAQIPAKIVDNLSVLKKYEDKGYFKNGKFKTLRKYISLNKYLYPRSFDINHVMIRYSTKSSAFKNSLCDDTFRCNNKDVLRAAFSTAEILEYMYSVRHPFKYLLISIKKNIALRIMNLYIEIRYLRADKRLKRLKYDITSMEKEDADACVALRMTPIDAAIS